MPIVSWRSRAVRVGVGIFFGSLAGLLSGFFFIHPDFSAMSALVGGLIGGLGGALGDLKPWQTAVTAIVWAAALAPLLTLLLWALLIAIGGAGP